MNKEFKEYAIKEVLKLKALVDEYINEEKKGVIFLCNNIKLRDMDPELGPTFKAWFIKQRPDETQYTNIYNHDLFLKDEDQNAWWDINRDDHDYTVYEQKRKFLDAVLDKLEAI